MFIGDYVRRLEQYVESYRFDRPYSSGDDTVVVSLRDDVMGVRGECFAEANNLLGASNDLASGSLPSESGGIAEPAMSFPAWYVPAGGCTSSGSPAITENCVIVRPYSEVEASMVVPVLSGVAAPGAGGRQEPPRAFQVEFAPNSDLMTPPIIDYTDAAAWVQDVMLPVGVYRLSWYGKDAATVPDDIDGEDAVRIGPSDTPDVFTADPNIDGGLTTGWQRYFRFFAATEEAIYSVGVYPTTPMEMAPFPQRAGVAGIQLEDVTSTVGSRDWSSLDQLAVDAEPSVFYPPPFESTTAQGVGFFDSCLTHDPQSFADRWTYRCEPLCAGGFGSEHCSEDEQPTDHCFWEYAFPVTEEMLLSRDGGFGGGFAFGNFNYRSGTIAVNVVGTGVRDCSGPDARACFGLGTLPFSLRHTGMAVENDSTAYSVRTHEGELENVFLFNGQIESGRALAAERFLTNPVSSSDRALLADYGRGELRGRPMPGFYSLRIWDQPGIEFDRIEDVQILWNYRYFTRTGESFVNTCTPGP